MLYFCVWLVIQILLESLPVSSSGHIQLFELLLKKINPPIYHCVFYFPNACSIDLIDHFAHGATILVLLLFFLHRWFFLLRNIRRCFAFILKIIGLAFLADVATSLFYILFHCTGLKSFFPLSVGFAITALLLFSLYWCDNQKHAIFNWRMALILGMVQGIALLPGISRLASTYVVGRWMGLKPHKAFEISWLIFFPLLCAAFLNSLRIIIFKQEALFLLSWHILLIMAIAAIGSYFLLQWSARLAYAHKWWRFGVYMLVPIVISILLIFFGMTRS
jgi:undecaprenyl-diphosphatase